MQCLNIVSLPDGLWCCPRCVRSGRAAELAVENQVDEKPTKNDHVVFYERVSSKGQDQPQYGRVGVETQRDVMIGFARERGFRIRHTFGDVGSAWHLLAPKKHKNGTTTVECTLPEYREMLEYAQKYTVHYDDDTCKGVCIVVYSVSRFGRNLAEVSRFIDRLHRAGSWVYSVSDAVSSRDPRFLLLTRQAEQQSADLSAVMKASIESRKQKGHFIGPAPYGYEAYRDAQGARRIRLLASEAAGLAILKNNRLTVKAKAADLGWTTAKVHAMIKRLQKLGLVR